MFNHQFVVHQELLIILAEQFLVTAQHGTKFLLPIGELTIGDYLRKSGIRTGIVGKTHMKPDTEGMARLGINKDTEIGLIVSEPGFEPYERDDGLHPNNHVKKYKKIIL